MRRLIGIIVIAALAWAGYWFVAARGLDAGLRTWLEARRTDGWVADYSALKVRGFPNRLDTTISDLVLADPETGLAWSAPFFQILALSYKPHHVIVAWPHEQMLATPLEKLTLSSEAMQGSIVFRPGTDLPLERANFVLDTFNVVSDRDWTLAFEKGLFATRSVPVLQNTHKIGVEAKNVRPSTELLKLLGQTGMPEVFEHLKIDANLTFDKPWDRFAIEQRRPQLTAIDLKHLQAEWGHLALQAAGELTVSAAGLPTGDITLRATNWREMVQIATASGAIPEELAGTLENALSMIAGLSGRPETLDVTLNFSGGRMWLGPVPLGPAPDLSLR